ncbi:hypothetical protein PFISCL1PPCAC_9451, partial [Pristionchus fissidentatus]
IPSLFLPSIHQESFTTMKKPNQEPEEVRSYCPAASDADKRNIIEHTKKAAAAVKERAANKVAAAAANPSGLQPVDDPMNGGDEERSRSKSLNVPTSSGPSTSSFGSLPSVFKAPSDFNMRSGAKKRSHKPRTISEASGDTIGGDSVGSSTSGQNNDDKFVYHSMTRANL